MSDAEIAAEEAAKARQHAEPPKPEHPKPEEPPPGKGDEEHPLAAEPKQEMGLSESTLHWLVDGEQAIEPVANEPGTAPHYDARAPVAGRWNAARCS